MEDQIKQIGERLKGLREVLDIPVEEVAALTGMQVADYERVERGEADPAVAMLTKISKRYGIDLDVLMFGEEPRMSNYFLTRKDQGLSVERRKDYKYQSLGAGYRGRKVEPFLVQVDPLSEGQTLHCNSHEGQEFVLVTEGTLELVVGGKEMTLNEGDSIYFNSGLPHGMKAGNGKTVKFLSVVI